MVVVVVVVVVVVLQHTGHLAAHTGQLEVMKTLISHDANVNRKNHVRCCCC
jgi:hypothetical protein